MPGPPPKPAALRRRRNAVTGPVSLPTATVRDVPRLTGIDRPLKSTREWWETVWASPMAKVYLDADVPALARLASFIDLASRGEAASAMLSEIRQLEDRFGLSPLARRRLQWEVDASAHAVPDPEPPDDEERFLRAVR